MRQEEFVEKLNLLTERQREILALVCEGKDYQSIGELLYIAEGTVKSHMGNIYVKLGLDQLSRTRRHKLLFESYCRLLPQIPENALLSPDTAQPDPVPRRILEMVKQDEKAIVQLSRQVVPMNTPYQRPSRVGSFFRFIFRSLLSVLLVAVGVVAGGFILVRWILPASGMAIPLSQTTETTEIPTPVESNDRVEPATAEPVVVIVTATSNPATATDEPTPLPPSQTPRPSQTPQPSATPNPTNTPEPSLTLTPANTGLAIGEWYAAGNISMTVQDVDLNTSPSISIGLHVSVRNLLDQAISFEYGSYNFRAVDNLGNSYTTDRGDFSRNLTLGAGKVDTLYSRLCCQVYFAVDHGNVDITEITFIVMDLSSIEYAEWVFPLYH